MLNAFSARSILELNAKDRRKIDSVLAYGDKLLLGLSTGALLVYRVLSPDSPDVSLSLLQTIDKFSRKPIRVLASIKEAGILVSLSDSSVHIHDLTDYSLTETLTKTRNASTLAVTSNIERDEATGIPSIVSRLAVAVKRRVLLYSWQDGGFQEGKEVTLGGNIISMTWASGRKVVAGLPSGFVAVDVHTGVAEEIAAPPPQRSNAAGGAEEKGWGGAGSYLSMGWGSSKPLSTRVSGDEMLLVKDTTTLFVDADGKPIPDKPPIPWPTPPDAVAFSYPYLVSLNSTKQVLEVRNPATQSLLQKISLPNVSTLHVPPPNVSLVHAGKLFYVASPTQVWRMGAMDYETQIKELIETDHLDEAISLLEILESVLFQESKEEKLREVQMLKAQRLFERGKWEESMNLFREASAPPERVIRLFPKAIAGELSIWDEEEDSESVIEEPNEQLNEGANDNTAQGDKEASPTPEPEANGESDAQGAKDQGPKAEELKSEEPTEEKASESSDSGNPPPTPTRPNGYATGSLKGLVFARKHNDASSIFSFGRREEDSDTASIMTTSVTPKHTQNVPEPPRPLEGDKLKRAAQDLARDYLPDIRRKLARYMQPDGTLIDPATVKGNAASKDWLNDSFLTVDGLITPEDDSAAARIEKLRQTSRLVDTTLFRTYMITMPSLVGSLVRLQNNCDPDVVSEKLREKGRFDELVDFLERKQLHRQALELLRFFGQADEENRAPSLHGPQRTVTYLERLKSDQIDLIMEFATWPLKEDPDLAMEIFIGDTGNSDSLPRWKVLDYLENVDHELAVRYLEHVITELKDMTPEFHTRLARLYLSVLDKDLEESERFKWRQRFLDFLKNSEQYRAEKVLGWLPRDHEDFYEHRAIVLSKMGRHKAALEIYVFKLQDPDKAEAYCTDVHLSSPPSEDDADSPTPATVYHTLLSLYLRPPAPYTQQLEPALNILSRHGARLEAAEVLGLIPEDIKVASLESYFQNRIRHANSKVFENRISAALRMTHLVDIRERLFLGARNKAVVVGEENVCPACHKRLGMSVIMRMPSGQVVHYGCAKRNM